jgi:hypothetical protein
MPQSQLNQSLGRIIVIGTLILSGSFGFPAHSQSLDQQATCAAQAKRALHEYSTENKELVDKLGMIGRSHYNPKINRCLILTDNTYSYGIYLSNHVVLWDALERRIYASWLSQTASPTDLVEVVTCELTRNFKDRENCTTREEFDAFVAEYMEE